MQKETKSCCETAVMELFSNNKKQGLEIQFLNSVNDHISKENAELKKALNSIVDISIQYFNYSKTQN
jgi:hypothetical protein